jgi:hypothetical protein
MPVTLSDAPAEALALVGRAVGDLMPPSRMRRFAAAMTGTSPARSSAPIPIYTLEVAALDRPQPLDEARKAGWRSVTSSGSQTAVVDLAGDSGDELRFNQMSRGSAAPRLIEACAWAERESQGQTDYEIRILTIPPLHLEALWMAGPDSNRFLLLRLPGAESLREIDFVAEARRLAAERRTERVGPTAADRGG